MKDWIPVVIAGISALGAIIAATIAARSATRSRNAELQARRILELETRLSASRADVFENLIELLIKVWDKDKLNNRSPQDQREIGERLQRYLHWVQIYGSDEAVRASVRFMQTIYAEPPPEIVIRMSGELVTTVRRELGDPGTTITALEVMATRVTDAYTNDEYYAALTDPLDVVFARYGWTPPWSMKTAGRATEGQGQDRPT